MTGNKRLLRLVSLVASFASALVNVACVARVLSSWRSLKWDFDAEADAPRVDAVKLVWCLLLMYFAAAATASTIGFVGIVRRNLNSVRFFRDYSIADLVFMFVTAVGMSYASFSSSSMLQAYVCEELGRQPELMRDLAESGLNLENCEYWFERAVIAALGMLLVFAVIRLHFVLALSKYYNQLRREMSYGDIGGGGTKEHALQRIYLLPTPTSTTFPTIHYNHQHHHSSNSSSTNNSYYHDDPSDDVVVYAPIPLSRLSVEEAKEIHATEAWVSPVPPSTRGHGHKHHHHRHHSHSQSHPSRQHRHRSTASLSSVAPYKDEAEGPLAGEKAV